MLNTTHPQVGFGQDRAGRVDSLEGEPVCPAVAERLQAELGGQLLGQLPHALHIRRILLTSRFAQILENLPDQIECFVVGLNLLLDHRHLPFHIADLRRKEGYCDLQK